MKYTKYILFFLFVAFFITECKKYPDGPCFSLRGKEARLLGSWDVETFLINDIDSISQLTRTNYPFANPEGTNYFGGHNDGKYKFENHGKNIRLTLITSSQEKTPFPITSPSTGYPVSDLSWEIQRLTYKEFWLKINYNNKEYYLKMKKI